MCHRSKRGFMVSNSEHDPVSVGLYIIGAVAAADTFYEMWVAHDVVLAFSGAVFVLSIAIVLMAKRISRLEERLAVRTAP